MKKHLLIGIIIGILLSFMTYFLLTNSHIDIFPATSSLSPTADPDYCTDPLYKDMISLMYLDDYDRCVDYSLTSVGYLMVFLVSFIIPMALGLWIGKLFKKKKV